MILAAAQNPAPIPHYDGKVAWLPITAERADITKTANVLIAIVDPLGLPGECSGASGTVKNRKLQTRNPFGPLQRQGPTNM